MVNIEKGKVKAIMSDFHKNVEERWTKDNEENLLMSRIFEELIFKNVKHIYIIF